MVQLIVLLVGLLVGMEHAQAATYYVATTGNDANSCAAAQNESTPKLTLTSGKGCLAGGDTLFVKAGTYANQEVTNPPAGSDAAYTIITGDPSGPRPILKPSSVGQQRALYCTNGAACHHIELSNFEIDSPYECMKLFGVNTVGYPHHVRFINNYCHHTKANGVITFSSFSGNVGGDHVFRNNEFAYCGIGTPNYLPGINTVYNPGNRALFENNIIHDGSQGVGIWECGGPDNKGSCGSTTHHINNVIIRNNIFYNMGRTDLNPWTAGATLHSGIHISVPGGGHQIYNNLFYNSGNTSVFRGIYIYMRPSGSFPVENSLPIEIYNNTIYNIISTSAYGIFHRTDFVQGGPHQIKNNIIYQVPQPLNAGGVQSNNLTTNPSFVNAAGADFSLQAGSAAIDAGVAVGYPYNGTAPDIGAFETSSNPVGSIAANQMTWVFPMSAAVPLQVPSAAGLSVTCTPNPTACPSSPTVSTATLRAGTESQLDIVISGIAGDACAAGQDWRLTYNSTSGGLTLFNHIGTSPGQHQKIFSFTALPATNLCDGTGPPDPPDPGTTQATYTMNEGTGTTANDTSGNGRHATLVGGASWGAGKTGTGVTVVGGSQQWTIPYGSGINPTSTSMTWIVPVYVPSGEENTTLFVFGTEIGTDQRAYIGALAGTWRIASQGTSLTTSGVSNLSVTAGWNYLFAVWDSAADTVTLSKGAGAGCTTGNGGATRSVTSFTFPTNFEAPIIGTGFIATTPQLTYDDVQLFTSIQDCSTLYANWNPIAPPAGDTFSQTAVQFEAVYLPELGGSPTILASPGNTKKVVKGGAVAVVGQIECNNCAATAFRLEVRDNGTGDWTQISNTETTSNVYAWGVSADPFLNAGMLTTRVLANGCTVVTGSTQLTSSQIPSLVLPASGCTMLRYILRIRAGASGYTEFRFVYEGGLAFTGSYVLGRIDIIDPQAGGVGF